MTRCYKPLFPFLFEWARVFLFREGWHQNLHLPSEVPICEKYRLRFSARKSTPFSTLELASLQYYLPYDFCLKITGSKEREQIGTGVDLSANFVIRPAGV